MPTFEDRWPNWIRKRDDVESYFANLFLRFRLSPTASRRGRACPRWAASPSAASRPSPHRPVQSSEGGAKKCEVEWIFEKIQGDPSGQRLHFVPPCCLHAMPVLPDLQLSKQNKADMVTAVANLSQQNVVANLTGHTVLHNSMQPQLGHFIENELYWQPRRVPLHPRLLQRSGRNRIPHWHIVSNSFRVNLEY